jgi:hypothetical protein
VDDVWVANFAVDSTGSGTWDVSRGMAWVTWHGIDTF